MARQTHPSLGIKFTASMENDAGSERHENVVGSIREYPSGVCPWGQTAQELIDFEEKTSISMKSSGVHSVTVSPAAGELAGHAAASPRRLTGKEDDAVAVEAKRILRAEMARRGYNFKRLSEALSALQDGEPVESEQVLSNKVNRGRFTFAFFLRATRAMGIKLTLE